MKSLTRKMRCSCLKSIYVPCLNLILISPFTLKKREIDKNRSWAIGAKSGPLIFVTSVMMLIRSRLHWSAFNILLVFLFSCSCFTHGAEAYNQDDPNGDITIKWDLMNWTPDGYVAVVTIYNMQKNRSIKAPGWKLSWTWARKEFIWAIIGAQTKDQGDCSKFKGTIPNSCKNSPTIMDLSPKVPYDLQIENCCKGGLLSEWSRDGNKGHDNSVSAFQIVVGQAGTSKTSVKLPKSFIFKASKDHYVCGPAKIVKSTKFITPDKRRTTQALMTWNVTCAYAGGRHS